MGNELKEQKTERLSISYSSFLKKGRWGGLLVTCLVLSSLFACAPKIAHRGYIPKEEAVSQVKIGMARGEVQGLLGTPSTTAFDGGAVTDYYISSKIETTPIVGATEVDRTVLVLGFNGGNRLEHQATYGLEDGRIVNFNDRTTPVADRDRPILSSLFDHLTPSPLPIGTP